MLMLNFYLFHSIKCFILCPRPLLSAFLCISCLLANDTRVVLIFLYFFVVCFVLWLVLARVFSSRVSLFSWPLLRFRWMAIFRVESDLYIHPSIGTMYALSTTTTTTTITIFSPCRFIQASIFCWLESICIHYVIMNVSLYISSDVWNVIFGLAFFLHFCAHLNTLQCKCASWHTHIAIHKRNCTLVLDNLKRRRSFKKNTVLLSSVTILLRGPYQLAMYIIWYPSQTHREPIAHHLTRNRFESNRKPTTTGEWGCMLAVPQVNAY